MFSANGSFAWRTRRAFADAREVVLNALRGEEDLGRGCFDEEAARVGVGVEEEDGGKHCWHLRGKTALVELWELQLPMSCNAAADTELLDFILASVQAQRQVYIESIASTSAGDITRDLTRKKVGGDQEKVPAYSALGRHQVYIT